MNELPVVQTVTGPLREYSFSSEDLPIANDRVASAMGYGGAEMGPEFNATLDKIKAELPQHAAIRAAFVVVPAEALAIQNDGFSCNGLSFNTGKLIAAKIRAAETMAFFTASAGIGIDTWSKAMFGAGNFLEGYLIDSLGSEIAEAAADAVEACIKEYAESSGSGITNRYSPGYCGWHVSEQQKLFSLLPPKVCGISLTESSLMIPIKSVSGIVGIGKSAVKKEYQCAICEMQHCFKRKKMAP